MKLYHPSYYNLPQDEWWDTADEIEDEFYEAIDLSEEVLRLAGRVGEKEDIDGPFHQWTVRQWWDLGKSPLAKYYNSFYTDEIREKVRELYQPDFDLIAQAKE